MRQVISSPNQKLTEGGPGWGWGSLYYMRTRPLQDKHDDRSPRLVKHSGVWQQKAVLAGGPKVWAIYNGGSRAFSSLFLRLFFFLFPVTKYSAIHDSCSFCFITTMLWVALEIGYISIAKSVVFSRWATVRHVRTILIGNYRSASIYGGLGAARRHW